MPWRWGIISRLLAAAREVARRNGFATLRIRSRVERGHAHDIFEKQGFRGVKTQRVYERLVAENGTTNVKE
jgi:GNAT superfamily N-acetyltransferase